MIESLESAMSSSKEYLIQKALDEFPSALKSALPLDHFCQFYDGPHFDKLAKQLSKEVLTNVQASSELDVEETVAVGNELLPKFLEMIRGWRAKNEENKTQCDHFLQSQVDFLLSDFRTSVMIKLVSFPDVGLQDLETFLAGRKVVVIDIFGKLSKPGYQQSSVNMKTRLNEKLECVKLETLEKQGLHLEQKATERAQEVLEEAKAKIMEIAGQLKSDLNGYHDGNPKELVKGKLGEIDYFLSLKGKALKNCHRNVYSAVLQTTAEVRKCLDEEDYNDMTAEEFAETLHEQLLYDFAGENHAREFSTETGLGSISLRGKGACVIPGNEEVPLTVPQQNEICANNESEVHNGLHVDVVEEKRIKEEKDRNEVDPGSIEIGSRHSNNIEIGLIQSEDDGGNLEEDEGNEMAKSSKSPEDNLECGRGNSVKYRKRISMSNRSSHSNNSRRRPARVQNPGKPIAAKRSRRERRYIVVETNKTMDDDKCSGSSSEDSKDSTSDETNEEEMDIQVGSGKSHGSKTRGAGKCQRRPSDDDNANPKTDKITYLYLDKRGQPIYLCNVCFRKCRQSMLRYHGAYCGKSDDPFTCKECGKTFMNKAHLDAHARIHTGEKPFKCSKCSKRFSVKYNLQKHVRSHSREARCICEPCKMTFSSNLRLHEHKNLKHKAELPFGCVYCKERFDLVHKLKSHVICHAGIRPLKCPTTTCDLSTTSKYSLASHIRKMHSKPKQIALKLANEAAIAYLVKETKDASYHDIPGNKANSLVVSHIIKKANLKLPEISTRNTVHRSSIP